MKRHAPATVRNRAAIAQVLASELPPAGLVLEVASGTGEHVVHFARLFPDLMWQPSDADDAALQSITAWRAEASAANVLPPVHLDAAAQDWPFEDADAIVCINMLHISVASASAGLFRHAARILAPGAPLLIYGPFIQPGIATAPSNVAFDAELRARNPEWGLRSTQDVNRLAAESGFSAAVCHTMPANNLMLVFRRASV
ncbi:DUF938 domain-containing protein [Porphyrobacter sp. GA68]|uniref:DUF938 domain-containing protein n=1 Tax=Porphyrobacter sp. GA68 TaxID=2883480 RepID=UPI001D18809F|nr:DUF938 domain-containing protein [Porphyrobacter sp. GA68]